MNAPHQPHPPLEQSERFRPPPKRRDFLGLAAAWTTVVAFVGALVGSMRLPMPAVFPESSAQVKIGPPEDFPKGSVVAIKNLNAWVFHDDGGLYVISAICTHLGCVTARDAQSGVFHCPCHGSVFGPDGELIAGPAPKPLNWLAASVAPDGQVVVDQWQTVPLGTRLAV
jgi:cytochrome b6-f complex iron-sulfur subunit